MAALLNPIRGRGGIGRRKGLKIPRRKLLAGSSPAARTTIIGFDMSADHKIEKPVLFISHATTDAEFAIAVQQEIEKVFANGLEVFCTSSPAAISPGSDWLTDIENKLSKAQAVIAIITPTSIERPWLWFEVGATWGKGRAGDCKIYPLCAKEINLSELPSPLDRLQALSLGRAQDLKILFEALVEQFGFGNIKAFRASNIISRVPKYKNVEVKEVDITERSFYKGQYSGYDDDELMDVIDEYYVKGHFDRTRNFGYDSSNNICLGELIHFKRVDADFELPPGTAKRLLIPVAARYQLIPKKETQNTLRLVFEDDEEYEEDE